MLIAIITARLDFMGMFFEIVVTSRDVAIILAYLLRNFITE